MTINNTRLIDIQERLPNIIPKKNKPDLLTKNDNPKHITKKINVSQRNNPKEIANSFTKKIIILNREFRKV